MVALRFPAERHRCSEKEAAEHEVCLDELAGQQ
jgi:hypothetical protein